MHYLPAYEETGAGGVSHPAPDTPVTAASIPRSLDDLARWAERGSIRRTYGHEPTLPIG